MTGHWDFSIEDENHTANVAIFPSARLLKNLLYGDKENFLLYAWELYGLTMTLHDSQLWVNVVAKE